MKYNSLLWGCAVILLACSTAKEGSDKLEFETTKVKKTARLENNNASPRFDISISMPYAKGDGSRARMINNAIEEEIFMMQGLNMQQAVDSFVSMRCREYIEYFSDFYEKDKAEGERSGWYECYYNLKAHTKQNADTIVNYVYELDTYEGGAHGMHIKGVMNFSKNTGRQVTLADVLLPGFEHRLSELLLDKLIKQTKSKDIDGLREKGYLYDMDMAPAQMYMINDNGITFIYNPYEIASFAVGMTELKMSWSELKDIVPNRQ